MAATISRAAVKRWCPRSSAAGAPPRRCPRARDCRERASLRQEEAWQNHEAAGAGAGCGDSGCAAADVPGGGVRAGPPQRVGADGCDDSIGADARTRGSTWSLRSCSGCFPRRKRMAAASPAELEELIKPTGFFRNKAKSHPGRGRVLVERVRRRGAADDGRDAALPGVARKTANVVLGSWYEIRVGRGGGHARAAALAAAGADEERRPGEGGAGPDEDHSAGSLDSLLARADSPRAADLRGADAAVRGLHAGDGCATRVTRPGPRTDGKRLTPLTPTKHRSGRSAVPEQRPGRGWWQLLIRGWVRG